MNLNATFMAGVQGVQLVTDQVCAIQDFTFFVLILLY